MAALSAEGGTGNRDGENREDRSLPGILDIFRAILSIMFLCVCMREKEID